MLATVLSILFLTAPAMAFDHTHAAFTKILQTRTQQKQGQTWVNYTDLKNQSRSELQAYLRGLEAFSADEFALATKPQRLAFLINAYNAFTLEWILIHHPVKSIKDTGSLFSSPWKKTFPGFKLLGQNFTLDKIEHEWIRGNFTEPRIHFAVNCASLGCPSLARRAYTGTGLEQELAAAEREFFFNPRHFKLDGKSVSVSSILDWYGGDFEKVHGSLGNYLSRKALEFALTKEAIPNLKISFSDYDWSLNGK